MMDEDGFVYFRQRLKRMIITNGYNVYPSILENTIDAVPEVAYSCVIGVPVGQILGRWGNFFNREAFGKYTDGLFAMRLPVSAVRADEITAEMRQHIVSSGGVDFIQAHPTIWETCAPVVRRAAAPAAQKAPAPWMTTASS